MSKNVKVQEPNVVILEQNQQFFPTLFLLYNFHVQHDDSKDYLAEQRRLNI
jgi:hypothetical protein